MDNCLRFANPAEASWRLGGLEAWRLGGLEAWRGRGSERLRKTSEVAWIFAGFSWYGGVEIRSKINRNHAWGGLGEVLGGRKSFLEVFGGDLGCILGVLRVPCRTLGGFLGGAGVVLGGFLGVPWALFWGGLGGLGGNISLFLDDLGGLGCVFWGICIFIEKHGFT